MKKYKWKKRNGWKGTVRLYHCRKPSHLPACGALSGRWRTWSSCWTSSTAAPGTWSAASAASARTAAASPASPSALASRWEPTWTPPASETTQQTPSGFLCGADHELAAGHTLGFPVWCWSWTISWTVLESFLCLWKITQMLLLYYQLLAFPESFVGAFSSPHLGKAAVNCKSVRAPLLLTQSYRCVGWRGVYLGKATVTV